jgi:Protein of unknown function (DUF3108)
MARFRVWIDSSAMVLGRTAFALAVIVSLVQPARMRAQLLTKPETPAAQRPIPVLQPPPATFDYPQHETLTYSVDWRVFTTGTAVFHLDQVGNLLKISATADTIGAVNMLFPVIDRFQSSFDVKTGCSTGFDKQTQEGRRKIASDLSFDYTHGKQTRNERNLVKGTATHSATNIPACVTDLLSGMFYTQSQTLTVGQTVEFPLADAMRTVSVGMKVEDREEIKTPAGTFQTIKVQATADEGVVKNRGSIWIWYTDDPRHLPVQMQARLFWGTITFHLQSVDFK